MSSGTLYVVAAPSGTGKTTLVKALVESIPNITVSISHTTRPKRPAEIDGVNYHFIDQNTFKDMIKQEEFLEHATVFGNLYGTSNTWVKKTLEAGNDVILEIDWQGYQQIRRLFPKCIGIFILPPSAEALSDRLVTRNQDKPEVVKQRLADIRETVSHIHEFDYVLVNDSFETAVTDLKTIVLAGRLVERIQTRKYAKLIEQLA